MARVPISLEGVVVSVEMPKRWVNAPFPITPVPANLRQTLSSGSTHTLWVKDWSWSRSWFRGGMGLIHFDAWITKRAIRNRDGSDEDAAWRKANLLRPGQLLTYVENATGNTTFSNYYRYSLEKLGDAFWVRIVSTDKRFKELPTSESWYLGIAEDLYLSLDFACIRQAKGEAGDRWLASALYWQNRMIASLQITGLKQILTGNENATVWKFPEQLKPETDLPK